MHEMNMEEKSIEYVASMWISMNGSWMNTLTHADRERERGMDLFLHILYTVLHAIVVNDFFFWVCHQAAPEYIYIVFFSFDIISCW